MSLEAGLHAYLTADPAVAALVVTRVTPSIVPQNSVFPAISYFRVTGQRVRSLDGPAGRGKPLMQIDLWAESYAETKALADAVRRALDGYAGPMGAVQVDAVSLNNEQDVYEDAPELYRVIQDYMISHQET